VRAVPSPRLTLAGLVLVITVVAVEAMAVATVMPTVVRHLHGLHWYGWSFTAYFLADVVGMVNAGARTDRHGPRGSLIGGLGLFGVGLLTAGLAPDMAVFTVGRAFQGLGGGSLIVAVYVIVARGFDQERRPRVFAALSGAWVVPALIGPAAAGAVTDWVGWRWVFLGIAPIAVLGAVMLVPVVRRVSTDGTAAAPRLGLVGGVRLAGGLALGQLAGQRLDGWSIPLLLLAILGAGPPLVRLLPAGALRGGRGLPTAVILRGLLSGGFFGAEAYLPLTLARLHHGAPTEVGIPLTLGAVGWSAGSWWQGRFSADDRSPLLRAGFSFVAIGVASLVVLTFDGVSMWVAAPIWMVAGTGMGLAMSSVSVLVLQLSPVPEQGANSAALQVADVVGSTIGVTVAATAVLVAGTPHLATALRVADPLLALIGIGGLLMVSRVSDPATAGAYPTTRDAVRQA
jgi:MFS family permease